VAKLLFLGLVQAQSSLYEYCWCRSVTQDRNERRVEACEPERFILHRPQRNKGRVAQINAQTV